MKVINQAGIALIKKYEGFRAKPYLCPARIPTIGYGATYYPNGSKVTMNDREITEPQAQAMLIDHLSDFVKHVNRYTTDINLTDNQFSALVSFAYNVGIGALQKSTLLKKVRTNPSDKSIHNEFLKWSNANGKQLAGLLKRRTEESYLYHS